MRQKRGKNVCKGVMLMTNLEMYTEQGGWPRVKEMSRTQKAVNGFHFFFLVVGRIIGTEVVEEEH